MADELTPSRFRLASDHQHQGLPEIHKLQGQQILAPTLMPEVGEVDYIIQRLQNIPRLASNWAMITKWNSNTETPALHDRRPCAFAHLTKPVSM